MRTLLLLAALCSYLLTTSCPAKAQQTPTDFLAVPIVPVKVTRIDSGTTVRRNLVGFTPTAYKELRTEMAVGERLLVVRSGDLAVVRGRLRLDSLAISSRDKELQRRQQVIAGYDAKLTAQEMRMDRVLSRPLQKPLLLSGQWWLGVLAGVVGGTILVLTH